MIKDKIINASRKAKENLAEIVLGTLGLDFGIAIDNIKLGGTKYILAKANEFLRENHELILHDDTTSTAGNALMGVAICGVIYNVLYNKYQKRKITKQNYK